MKTLSKTLRYALIATLTLAAGMLGGCRAYQWGNPTELPFKSIYIQPATNDSYAPQAQALLSAHVREAVIRDGRARLVTSEDAADAVLLVNITEYKRQTGARRSDDTTIARDFDLTLTAEVSLFNQSTGDYYFQERTLKERSNAYVSNPFADAGSAPTQDLLQSEYQAMPRITRDLARKIADEVLSPWAPKK